MKDSVTGRDTYIVCKALAYAIEAIELLPHQWREHGDQADMKRLLESLVENDGQLYEYQRSARNHLSQGGEPIIGV